VEYNTTSIACADLEILKSFDFFHSRGSERPLLLNCVHFYIFKDTKRQHSCQKESSVETVSVEWISLAFRHSPS